MLYLSLQITPSRRYIAVVGRVRLISIEKARLWLFTMDMDGL